MNLLTLSPQEQAEGLSIDRLAGQAIQEWSASCQWFLDWQRSEIMHREPSLEKLERHRTVLKWLLRFAKAVYMTASDPDYPDKKAANELRGRLIQLEHSWRMVHEPMPAAEAEMFLREVFPE
jgi:hypothetical protein